MSEPEEERSLPRLLSRTQLNNSPQIQLLRSSSRERLDSERLYKAQQEQKECRICFQTETAPGSLLNPCSCRGTMAYVHEECLIRWFTEKQISRCELCKHTITFQQVFSLHLFLRQASTDLQNLFSNGKSLLKLVAQSALLLIYIRHFLPIVRFIRTKMFRNLCKLWILFEQEEKLRTAYRFSMRMKLNQVVTQEIPITIKLMVFMWVLRKFVSIGARFLLQIGSFMLERYMAAKEMRYIKKDK